MRKWLLVFVLGCGSSSAAAAAGVDAAGDAGGGAVSDGPATSTDAADAPGSDASASLPDGSISTSGRPFPDTTATIAILADQLPSMSAAQLQFAATHYVGTQKQVLPVTQALRAISPGFLVLHYHLAMWQSAPATTFIVDGATWSNDYPTVTTHEDWFWHGASGQRVPSSADGKLLMNVSTPGFQSYWAQSLAAQVKAGDYDAIFLDSASPALLQGECSAADPRLAGTAARGTTFAELGNATWIAAWQTWISSLSSALAAQGIPLIPNTSAFVTTWDDTDYGLTPGIFSEGFADPSFAVSDWQASTTKLLSLAAAGKMMILQNYLSSAADVQKRLYYLGNYLLVKGSRTYLDYFASGPLEWYPEWQVDLGAPTTTGAKAADLLGGGLYRRDFAKGSVLVNPSASAVTVALGGTFRRVVPSGGGAVDASGNASGSLSTTSVTSLTVAPASAEIVLR